MYLDHFGLNTNPFSLSHELDFLYKSGAFQESMAHLIYGLDNREPVVLITGAIGTGKTMALQSFLSNLGPSYNFALITNTKINAVELLKLILEDLGARFPLGCDKSDLLILFKDLLITSTKEGRKVLIVVDEAQNLSHDVLEEIRLLTNLGQGEGQPVQIILSGQPELEEIVNRPELAQLRQRIRVHYKLDPLARQEVQEYIDHRMRVAGCDHKVFSPAAIDRIFRISGGVPRLVNTHCAEALLSAYVAGKTAVGPEHVDEAPEAASGTASRPLPEAAAPAPRPPLAAPVEAVPPPRPEAPLMAQKQRRRRRRRLPLGWAFLILLAAALAIFYATGRWDDIRDALSGQKPASRQPVLQQEVSALAVVSQAGDDAPLDRRDSGPPADQAAPGPPADQAAPDSSSPGIGQETSSARALPTKDQDQGPAAEPSGNEDFCIHIASFLTEERATISVRTWERRGDQAFYRKDLVNGKEWYRVYLGPFPSREAASERAAALRDSSKISWSQVSKLASGPGH